MQPAYYSGFPLNNYDGVWIFSQFAPFLRAGLRSGIGGGRARSGVCIHGQRDACNGRGAAKQRGFVVVVPAYVGPPRKPRC